MAALKLYSYPNNPSAQKALIAAKFGNVAIEQPSFTMGQDNKAPDFLEQFPVGKVPVLVTPEGGLFESNAIARYVAKLADTALVGRTPYESSLIDAWCDYSLGELYGPLLSWLAPLFGYSDYNKQKVDTAIAAIKKSLATLDRHLKHNTFLAAHRVTLADIVASCTLQRGFLSVFDEPFRQEFPCVTRWFRTLQHHPHFAAVWGELTLCETPLKFTPKPKEGKAKGEHKGEAKGDGKAAESKAEKPKAEKAAKPPPAAAAADDDEDKPAPKPKEKNPLDELPPSKMMLDSWKRLYSNTPAAQFREIAIKGLWAGADVPRSLSNEHFEGYDPEGFSMWFCDYKYNEENTVNFIVMNKVGGFLQRLDYVRKWAFGVICILKNAEGQFPIRGVWIFRGQDIPPIMQAECVDLELYTWCKVDLSDEAQKKRAEDMIVEEDKIDGLELIECKVFK